MNSTILTLENKDEWDSYLKKIPEVLQDIYYTPEYYKIYQNNGDGKALCFVFEEDDKIAFYPFLINSINDLGYKLDGKYFDIQGAYDYNGVIYSSDDFEFRRKFYTEFKKFCKCNNIIAEFTRFHPLITNHKFSEGHLDVSYNRKTVYVDLTKGYSVIYNNYSDSQKRALNKSKSNNLAVEIRENEILSKHKFYEMYKETMARLNARPSLYFNKKYFDSLFIELPVVLFIVYKEEKAIASALCISYKNYLHYHLGASKEEYWETRPNNLLFDSIIKYGIQNDKKILHLGYGRTTSDDDSLLKFKKNFAETTRSLFIGRFIHNEYIYYKLCREWMRKYPLLVNKYGDRLLKYRFID